MTEEEMRRRAQKRAEDKMGFYTHFGVYLAVNAFLALIWYLTSGPDSFPWFVFVLFGWGIGVVAHGISVLTGGRYVDRLAEREYQRMKRP
ncbi:MAG: 2TM domain-containing protein [Methanomassiliicoccales archaeon]